MYKFLYNWGYFFESVPFNDGKIVPNMCNITQWDDREFNIK